MPRAAKPIVPSRPRRPAPAVAAAVEQTEEYIDNRPTGMEADTDDGDVKPWNPDKIRIHTKPFSLRQILDMIEAKELDLAPDFQRSYVWTAKRKSLLIESILLGIPISSFYFNESKDGTMQVVDGVQRLSSIYNFARTAVKKDRFAMDDVESLVEVKGKTWQDLDKLPIFQRRFNNTQIFAHVIDPQTPTDVKFDVFKRVNTGGMPLTAQEIRHCMSKARSRDFLKRSVASTAFLSATDGAVVNHPRMADRELVLRFVAFLHLGISDYERRSSFDDFLFAMTDRLDDEKAMPKAMTDALFVSFERAMRNARAVFDDGAFRKVGNGRRGPINKALFEVWAVALASVTDERALASHAGSIKKAFAALMRDQRFVVAISQGTGDIGKVKYRFEMVQNLIAPYVGVPVRAAPPKPAARRGKASDRAASAQRIQAVS